MFERKRNRLYMYICTCIYMSFRTIFPSEGIEVLLGVRSNCMASVGICFASYYNIVFPCYRAPWSFSLPSTMSIIACGFNIRKLTYNGYTATLLASFAILNSPHWTTFTASAYCKGIISLYLAGRVSFPLTTIT